MFGFKKKNQNSEAGQPAELQTKDQPKEAEKNQSAGDSEVYVMPEKFHPKESSKSFKKTLTISLVALIIAVIVSGSYFIYEIWLSGGQPPADQDNQNSFAADNKNIDQEVNKNSERDEESDGNENINQETESDNENANANANINTEIDENANDDDGSDSSGVIEVSSDSDRDGLTDLEESIIGSFPTKPDSDSDGYLDGDELVNGYSPISAESGESQLLEEDFIAQLKTPFTENNFETYYISGWETNFIETLYQARITAADTGEIITISVKNNPDRISATNWYLQNHPETSLSQLTEITVGEFQGIFSPDKLTAYLTDLERDSFFVFEYKIMDEQGLYRYPSIFRMIINNFQKSAEPVGDSADQDAAATSTATSTAGEI